MINQQLQLARKIMSGFGFFGYGKQTRLVVDVNDTIDLITLTICAPKEEFLNIYCIRLFDTSGEEIKRSDVISRAVISSSYLDQTSNDVTRSVVNSLPIHSKAEFASSLHISLNAPTAISRVEIQNRSDKFHCRTRHILVRGFAESEIVFAYDNMDPSRMVYEFGRISEKLGLPMKLLLESYDKSMNLNEIKDVFEKRTIEYLNAGACELSLKDLISLLDITQSEDLQMNSYQMRICAEILIMLSYKTNSETTDLCVLSPLIRSKKQLDELQVLANEIHHRRTGDIQRIVVSRHIIHLSKIESEKNRYLNSISQLILLLKSIGIESCLSYGTLLGSVRSKSFLPHDDDVDLLYNDQSSSASDVATRQINLMKELNERGIHSWCEIIGENIHVQLGGVTLDLFPCWTTDKRTTLLMEGMKFRTINADIIFPFSHTELYGQFFPAPNMPEKFLLERYGEGWTIPDPYYEWPWDLL